MTQPANPPAFPTFEVIDQWDKDSEKYREAMLPTGGMTLRDYFAAKALQGFCSQMNSERFEDIRQGSSAAGYETRVAYRLADAMLRARERQE